MNSLMGLGSFLFFIQNIHGQSVPSPAATDSSAQAVEISLENYLVPEKIRQSDTVFYAVELKWTGASDLFLIEHPADPVCQGFRIISVQTKNTKTVNGSEVVSIKRFDFRLIAEKEGEGIVESVPVAYYTKNSSEKNEIRTRVVSVKIEEAPFEIPWSLLIGWGSVSLLLAGGAVGGVTLIQQRKKINKEKAEKQRAKKTPEEEAILSFQRIQPYLLAGEIKEFYGELENQLKSYLSLKYKFSFRSVSGEEIVNQIQELSEMNEEIKLTFRQIMEECRQVKFANVEPTPFQLETIQKKYIAFIQTMGSQKI